MHRAGHVGVTLAVYAPVAYLLIRAGRVQLAALGLIGMLVVEPWPDRDMEIPGLTHRGASHTLVGALFVGLLVAIAVIVGGRIVPAYLGISLTETVARSAEMNIPLFGGSAAVTLDFGTFTVFAFGIGVLAVVSHLLGDILTPMGIRPFWPVSRRTFSLSLWTASNQITNPLLLVLGVGVFASAVWFGTDLTVPSNVLVAPELQEVLY